MPRRARSKCRTPGCRKAGPYSRNLGLCLSCGLKRMGQGGSATSAKDKGSKCRKPGCRNAGPYSRDLGLCHSCGLKRMGQGGSLGGSAGSAEDKIEAGQRSGLRRKAQMALIIKKFWLDKILAGKKVWEVRSRSTKRRGWIHLAES